MAIKIDLLFLLIYKSEMPSGFPDKSLEDTKRRFHQSYTIVDECWLWNKHILPNGYGRFSIKGIYLGAHQASLIFHSIIIPEGHDVMHRCPKKKRCCVNPAHLTTGTRKQNMEDKKADGTNMEGERHPNSKLTEAQVLEIRERNTENQHRLAEEFGVAQTGISNILLRKTWKHI